MPSSFWRIFLSLALCLLRIRHQQPRQVHINTAQIDTPSHFTQRLVTIILCPLSPVCVCVFVCVDRCMRSKFIYLPNLFVRMPYETNKLECNDNKLQYVACSFGMNKNKRQSSSTAAWAHRHKHKHMHIPYIQGKLSIEQEKNNKTNGKIQQRRRHGTKAHIWDNIK